MTYINPSAGRGDKRQNTTNYEHPQETNLLNVHKAMSYNSLGEPVLRTTSGAAATANDAFGRLRVSNPFTLFESFRLYNENEKFFDYTAGAGNIVVDTNAGVITQTVGTASGDQAFRETSKVFAYQPGKSLQIMHTIVFAPGQTNLRQRCGYFDVNNGVYLELSGTSLSWNIRSKTTGSILTETATQSQWNIDPLDGTGTSTKILDITKAQIMWTDIEWLGVGSVRCGFVIDGEFVHCHTFHHANLITSTYMSTACLPIRVEIENTGTTNSSSTLKAICSTVISEGGYALVGRPLSVGHPIASAYTLSAKETFYPVLSIRLKSGRNNAIVLPNDFSIGVNANANFRYQLLSRAVTVGGSWVSAGANSSVEYNLTATTLSSGIVMEQGYIMATNQSSTSPQMSKFPFLYQLERNTFANTMFEFVIALEVSVNTTPCYASVNWEEIT